jgi:8-oxo-dGTP pyrophosphatase MutT (NUDIX family)
MAGAGVIITFVARDGNRYVLTGKESVYLSDSMSKVTLEGRERPIEELERGTRADFMNRAARIEAAIKKRVQFSQPENGTTKYRILPDTPKYGIPKGRRQGGEELTATANRELGEEVGITMNITDDKRVDNIRDYAIFRVDIQEGDASGILKRIAERMDQRYGELFDLKFRKVEDIMKSPNFITRQSLQGLSGGKRRTRKIRRRVKKTLRRKSRA